MTYLNDANPGPWEAVLCSTHKGVPCYEIWDGEGSGPFAFVSHIDEDFAAFQREGLDNSALHANAALVAAAPELVEALLAMVEMSASLPPDMTIPATRDRFVRAHEIAIGALTKALNDGPHKAKRP